MRLHVSNLRASLVVPRQLGQDYWLFWSGQTLSALGSSLTTFALPLLTYRLTGSAVNLALTTAATYLPAFLFGLVVGAWVDRADRRRVMIGAECGQAVVIALLPLAAWTGVLSAWAVYAVAFARATLGLFFEAAHFAAVPSLVADDELVRANGYLRVGSSVASILGPPIGGVLLVVLPIHALILVDAVSFAVSAASIAAVSALLRSEYREPPRQGDLRAGIAEGLGYVRAHRVLPTLLLLLFLVNTLGSAVSAELVLFAKVRLGAADAELGLLYAAAGVGAVVMGLLSPTLRSRYSLRALTIVPLVVHGLLIVVFAVAPNFPAAAVLWGLLMAQITLFSVVFVSVWQRLVPMELLGRVSSIVLLVAMAGIPLGAVASGVIIDRTSDPVPVFAVAGAGIALVATAFRWSPIREIDNLSAAR